MSKSNPLAPGLLDRAIAVFSPGTALQRMRHRAALQMLSGHTRRYDAAARGRRTANWRAPATSASSELLAQLPLLRARARDLHRNNTWAESARNVIVTNTIGTGLRPLPRMVDDDNPLHRRTAAVLEIIKEWAESPQVDADGRLDFYGMQELAVETAVQSGSVLVRRRFRRDNDGLAVPLQIQLLEPDHLDSSKDSELSNGGWIEGGIEFGPFGRREAYWLFRRHPGGRGLFRSSRESVRVPASEVSHMFLATRPGQVDGAPWGVSAFLAMRDLAEYDDAQLLRQKIAACFAAFVWKNDPDGAVAQHKAAAAAAGADDGKEPAIEAIEPGTVDYLEPGEQVVFGNPPAAQGFDQYMTTKLRGIARGIGVTYEALSGDYSRVNFSSGRMGWLEMARNVHRWRRMAVLGFCAPVFNWSLEALALSGRPTDGVQIRWSFPRREMLDPVKETTAVVLKIKNGLLPRGEALRQEGFEPAEVDAEYAEDLERARELGLQFESDPVARAALAPQTPPAADGDEEEEEDGGEESPEPASQEGDAA